MDNTPQVATSDKNPAVRAARREWIVPVVALAIGASVPIVLHSLPNERLDYDFKNILSFSFAAAGVLTAIISGVHHSPIPRRWKQGLAVGALAVAGVAVATLRLEDFSGDMHFRLAFRWATKADERLAPLPVASAPVGDQGTALPETTGFDYPQFLGPGRHATLTGIRLARDWHAHPPRLAWRQEIGAGWSAFAVVGLCAFTQEQRGERELVACYDLATGRALWKHVDEQRFASIMGGDGPRATPTVADGRVYAQTAVGRLHCLDGSTGDVIWTHDLPKETGAPGLNWGYSGSPLVAGGLVIASAGGPHGGSLVAYDALSGQLAWSSGDDQASYASPVVATIAGIEQVIVVNEDLVASHRLSDGAPLWHEPWPGSSSSNASTSNPVPLQGDRVFLSKGYSIGSKMLQFARNADGSFTASTLWEQPTLMKTKLTNVVVRDGFIYGLSGGILECIDSEKGARMWKQGRYGHGQVLLVDDLLLVTSESGEVALVEASPKAYHEFGRFTALEGKTWNNPALAGRFLLVRNSQEAACYELALE